MNSLGSGKKISVATHLYITRQKGALPRDHNGSDSTMHCQCLQHGEQKETHTDSKNMTGLIMCLGAKWDHGCSEHMKKKTQHEFKFIVVLHPQRLWIIRDGDPSTLTQLLHSESAWKLIMDYLGWGSLDGHLDFNTAPAPWISMEINYGLFATALGFNLVTFTETFVSVSVTFTYF